MPPFLSELTSQERNTLYTKLAEACKQYDRLAGFLLDSVHSWTNPQATAAFRNVMESWRELGDIKDDLNALPVA